MKLSFLALILFAALSSHAQNFEGKIIYQTSYKSKIPNVTDEQLGVMMGTTMEYIIKEGDYKTLVNGTVMQWQLYINKDNKLYNKMSNSETIFWNDGGTNPDEVIKAETNKGVENILGNPCNELVLTCKSGIQKYYFSPKYKANLKLYEKHKFGNWSDYLSRANALPLKMWIDAAQFTLECTAIEIKPMKLEQQEFQLPAGSKTEKSPY